MRDSSGQASVDYVVLLGLVSAVLLAGGAIGAQGALADAVGTAWGRALCRVAGDGCPAERAPVCVRSTTSGSGRVGAELAVVRISRSLGLLRETRSDGTIDLSLVDTAELGAQAGLGGEAHATAGTAELGGGDLLEAHVLGEVARKRTWHAADAAHARALERRILLHYATGAAADAVPLLGRAAHGLAHLAGFHGDELPRADVEQLGAGAVARLEAEAGPADVEAQLATTGSVTRDRRSGATSIGLQLAPEGSIAFARAAGIALLPQSSVSLTIAFAHGGVPATLAVTAAGGIAGHHLVGRPGDGLRAAIGNRGVVTAVLPLTDDEGRAALAALAGAVREGHGPQDVLAGAAARLGRLIRRDARLEVETYTSTSGGAGLSAEGAVGAEVGVDVSLDVVRTRLRGAWWRPPEGVLARNDECLA